MSHDESPHAPTAPALYTLTADELDLICRCMRAILDGPWLRCRVEHHDPDCNGHIHARMGIDWPALAHALATLEDDPHRADDDVHYIARRALAEVGLGIRFTEGEWRSWFGAPRGEVEALHRRLREP